MVNRNLTRQLFVEYERKSRGKTPAMQRQILREWTNKTAGQKDRLAKCLRRALDCDTVAEVHKYYADQKLQHVNNHPNTPMNASDYYHAQNDALEAQERQHKVVQEVLDAYEKLARQQRLQNGDAQSLAFTQRTINGVSTHGLPRIETNIRNLEQRIDQQMNVPLDAAGIRKMPVVWLSKNCYARKHTQRLVQDRINSNHQTTPNQQGGTWASWRHFGGGQAECDLWIQFDPNNTIIDRLVRKDVDYSSYWFDARFWTGQANDEGTREPLELGCHGQMERVTNTVVQPSAPLTPQAIQNLVLKITRGYRLYTAYCEFHDLGDIVADYQRIGQPIPEPFIWSVAETLMECALAMELGHTDVNNPNPITPDWQQIVHRDLKPANIFMTAPNPNNYPAYPQARVGDWGLAIKTSENDPNNPHWYQGPGTPGFHAPEHDGFVSQRTLRPLGGQMLACTNVWGIGTILYSLITIQTRLRQPGWLGDPTLEMMYHRIHNNSYNLYSNELIAVLQSCLTIDQTIRPGPAQLLTQIRAALQNNGPMTHMGMKDGTAGPALQGVNALTFAPDPYALGMAQVNLPPQQ